MNVQLNCGYLCTGVSCNLAKLSTLGQAPLPGFKNSDHTSLQYCKMFTQVVRRIIFLIMQLLEIKRLTQGLELKINHT